METWLYCIVIHSPLSPSHHGLYLLPINCFSHIPLLFLKVTDCLSLEVRPGCNFVVSRLLQVQLVVSGQHGGPEGGSALPLPESSGGGRWCWRGSKPGEHAAGGVLFQGVCTRRKAHFWCTAGHGWWCVGGGGRQHTACPGAEPHSGLQSGWVGGVLWDGRCSPLTHTFHGSVLQMKSKKLYFRTKRHAESKLTRTLCTSMSNMLIY